LNKLVIEIKDSRKLGRAIQEKVLPFVALIDSEIEKAGFVEEISNKLGVSDKVVWTELSKIKKEVVSSVVRQGSGTGEINEGEEITGGPSLKNKKNRKQMVLRQISGVYWWQKSVEKAIFNERGLKKRIKDLVGDEVFEKIENLNEKIKDEIIFEVEILYGDLENINEKVEELFRNLEIELIDEKIKSIIIEQKKAEKGGDTKTALKNLRMYDKLSKEKSKISLLNNFISKK